MSEKEILDKLSSWLENNGFVIKYREHVPSPRGWKPGPDIVAVRGNERWIIEAKNYFDKVSIDAGVGQLIRRMEEYGTKNTKFFLTIDMKGMKKVPSIVRSLGIGLILFNDVIRVIDVTVPLPAIPMRRGARRKDAILRFRTSSLTKQLFYEYTRERAYPSLEDALIELLQQYKASKVKMI